MVKPVLDQINLICGDVEASLAFYRRLGVDIPEDNVWRTATGAHHINAEPTGERPLHLELDSTAFAQLWNPAWKGRTDLRGRIFVGFRVPARGDVDAVFRDMMAGGYRGLQEPIDAFWGSRFAIIEDPDGIAVGVISPALADKKTPPPSV